jgi:hypothetical protein
MSEPRPVTSRIPELVARRGWTVRQFAAVAHLHYPTAWRLARRGDVPDSMFHTVLPCAKALGVDVLDLYNWGRNGRPAD